MQTTPRTVKVAVVGSGLAGLTAAYHLARTPTLDGVHFQVHLFEKSSTLGMDSHSVSITVPGSDGRPVERRIDVPMRSFQGGYYPQLIALYKHLGVQFRQRDYSYSFSTLETTPGREKTITARTIYNGDSGRAGTSMPASGVSKTNRTDPVDVLAFVAAYARFALNTLLLLIFYLRLVLLSLPLHAPTHLRLRLRLPFVPASACPSVSVPICLPLRVPTRAPDGLLTLRAWTRETTPRSALARALGLDARWRAFVGDVLVPLFSAVCTADAGRIWAHPVEEFLDYVWLTFGTHHYVAAHGVRDVVRRLAAPLAPAHVHLASPIVALTYTPPTSFSSGMSADATITVHCAGNAAYGGFAHVVLATQANHAAAVLAAYRDTLPPSPHTKGAAQGTQPQGVLARHRGGVQRLVAALRAVRYVRTVVVNHTDAALLPADPRDRRDLNLVMHAQAFAAQADEAPDDDDDDTEEEGTVHDQNYEQNHDEDDDEGQALCVPPTYAMATHVVPLPRAHAQTAVYQTTNPLVPPRAGSVLSAARLERAVVTRAGKAAVRGLWREAGEHKDENENEDEGGSTESGGWFGLGLGLDVQWAGALRWGCAGAGGGVLGPLQGAGRLPTDTTDGKKEGTRASTEGRTPGVWLCGSYAHAGIPLLEGCVVSARNVVEQGVWASEGVRAGAAAGW